MESHEDRAYLEVKKAIFHRQLLPGSPVREADLARFLGISRTPVRNAFRRLAREGLLDIQPNRGTYVVHPTPKEVRDTFLLRAHLEGLAVRLAAERITAEQQAELARMIEEEQHDYRTSQPWLGLARSNAWHEYIAGIADHPRLQQYISELISQSYVYFALYDVVDPGCLRSPGEHGAIVEALARGDGAAAERLMVEHFEKQLAALNLEGRGVSLPPWESNPEA